MRNKRLACRLCLLLLPVGIYLLASLAFHGFGHKRVKIKWSYVQLLDRQDLVSSPARSLLLLHSQPPVLNALLASCLGSSSLGIRPRTCAIYLFYGLGLASSVLLFMLVADLTRSRALAAAATVAMLLDPGFHLFQHLFFYPFIIHFLVIAALLFSSRALIGGDLRYFAGAALTAAVITNTRSLFHPIWALIFFLLLMALVAIVHGRGVFLRRKTTLVTVVFLALLLAWPVKNALLFGAFTFSTWSGVNLSRGTPVSSSVVDDYLNRGVVTPEIELKIERFARRFGDQQIHVLARPTRSNGTPNWNHYIFVETADELARDALRYRLANLNQWLLKTVINYSKWTRASFVQPYVEKIRGPNKDAYRAYASGYRSLFFADMRPLMKPVLDVVLSGVPQVRERLLKNRWTFFGAVGLPALLAVTLLLIGRGVRRGITAEIGALILALFILSWNLLVVCLTDGAEGNRMRFSVTPCLIVLGSVALNRVGARLLRSVRPGEAVP